MKIKVYLLVLQSSSQLTSKQKTSEKLESHIQSFEEQSVADTQAVSKAQEHYHAVSAGLSSNDDGEDKTLADQLMGIFFLINIKELRLKIFGSNNIITLKFNK